MTAEDRCRVLKDLWIWSQSEKSSMVKYMEERMYAITVPKGFCVVKANSKKEAFDKVRGKWGFKPIIKAYWIERFDILKDDKVLKDIWLECSHCHNDSDYAFNFCPNCGADMRGDE